MTDISVIGPKELKALTHGIRATRRSVVRAWELFSLVQLAL